MTIKRRIHPLTFDCELLSLSLSVSLYPIALNFFKKSPKWEKSVCLVCNARRDLGAVARRTGRSILISCSKRQIEAHPPDHSVSSCTLNWWQWFPHNSRQSLRNRIRVIAHCDLFAVHSAAAAAAGGRRPISYCVVGIQHSQFSLMHVSIVRV